MNVNIENNWISVNDELPPDGKLTENDDDFHGYLCRTQCRFILERVYAQILYYENGKWWNNHYSDFNDNQDGWWVTHWQKIVFPKKEEVIKGYENFYKQ